MAEGEYMKFLFAIAGRRDLTATAKIVYSRISDRIGNNPHAFPGMRRLAKDCGCGLYAVKTAIRQLEDVGLIAVKRPSGNPARQTNCYRVIPGGCKPTRSDIPIRGANQHVAESAVGTCWKAPSVRGANQHTTRPIEPDLMNQKKTPPTPPKGGVVLEDLPEALRTETFLTAWRRWAIHRKEIRHKLTPSTIKSQLKMLAKLGETAAIASIEQSIEKGWQGLFEPQENSRGKPTRSDPDAAAGGGWTEKLAKARQGS